jgi:hypothetical protein
MFLIVAILVLLALVYPLRKQLTQPSSKLTHLLIPAQAARPAGRATALRSSVLDVASLLCCLDVLLGPPKEKDDGTGDKLTA